MLLALVELQLVSVYARVHVPNKSKEEVCLTFKRLVLRIN